LLDIVRIEIQVVTDVPPAMARDDVPPALGHAYEPQFAPKRSAPIEIQ
jgi:hypothetical protein